jgi:hypothetical protein
VFPGSGHFRVSRPEWRGGGKIGPLRWNVRFAAIRQDDDKEQLTVFIQMPKDLERLPFKRMMAARDGDPIRIVPEVGSLRWFPSTKSITSGCSGFSNTGSLTSGSFD